MSDPIWRLIIDGPVPGAMNMALDRVVLARRSIGDAPPTLRLYRWELPTVSLGRFQGVDQVDLAACARRGFDVVRRPTGGRGVLHDDELTYSIVAGTADGVPRGVTASYRHLSAALAAAYLSLGVPAEVTARSRGEKGAGSCYLHATPADLSLGAAKLSGSAQVWKDEAVLQHGCFVISRDVDAEAEVFRLDDRRRTALGKTTATLAEAMGSAPSVDAVAAAVVAAVERVLGVALEPGSFTDEERDSAAVLAPEHVVQSARRGA
ncbi:MAG TPA: lipoate--protein ligase family protein [Coriobacteriia bacterium]